MDGRVIGSAAGAAPMGAWRARAAALAERRPRLLLVLFCLALWLPGFFTLPPTDRDESRFAQASKQMNETGDYLRIMNGTTPRNRKPIGIYWLQAPVARLAGPGLANPIWPYRVPSLAGGVLAVLATFQAGLVLLPTRRAAALAGAMLAGSVLLTAEAHIAKTDAALLGATTLAMALLAQAWMGQRLSRWQAAAFWLAASAGILLKGPITPLVLGLTVGALCIGERRAGWLRKLRPGWGIPLMLAAVLPWFVAIGVATHGRFFSDAVGGDLGSKLAGGAEAHGGPPGLHLLLLPLLAFPSTLPVAAGLACAWQRRREPATRFLLAWLVPAWLVFEAVPTKLPHYALPLYPALFLLAAAAWNEDWRSWPRLLRAAGAGGAIAAALLLAGAACAAPIFLRGPVWLGLPAALCAGVAGYLAWRRRAIWALVSAIPLYAGLLGLELPLLPNLWIAPRVASMLRQAWPDDNAMGRGLAVAGYAEPSLMFLAGTDMALLYNGAQAAQALHSGEATAVLVSDRQLPAFLAAAAALAMKPQQLGVVAGLNPSRGRWVSLTLLTK